MVHSLFSFFFQLLAQEDICSRPININWIDLGCRNNLCKFINWGLFTSKQFVDKVTGDFRPGALRAEVVHSSWWFCAVFLFYWKADMERWLCSVFSCVVCRDLSCLMTKSLQSETKPVEIKRHIASLCKWLQRGWRFLFWLKYLDNCWEESKISSLLPISESSQERFLPIRGFW